jgi:putative oxidoreductase
MNRFLSSLPVSQDAGLALVRIVTGYFMIYHGSEIFDAETMKSYDWVKTSPSMVYLGKAAELLAGLLLLPGMFTRVGALIMIGTLGYIAFFVGKGKVWYDDQHPFMFVLLGILFLFLGGGRYSVDHLLFDKKNKK